MCKIKYIILFSLISIFFSCDNLDLSSSQASTFIKFLGVGNSEIGTDVIEFNNGYVILATVNSNIESENAEIILMQTNKFGNPVAGKTDTLFKNGGGNNTASKLLKTSDGGFIVLGTVEDTSTTENYTEIYLNKFNSSFESEWEQFIGDAISNEVGSAIKKASSGYIITGSTDAADMSINNTKGSSDIFLVKTDDLGEVEWTENHGGSGDEYASDIISKYNGYLIVGSSNSFNEPGQQANSDIILIETNLTGGSPDNNIYGGSNNDYGVSLVQIEGGYLVMGTVENVSGDNTSIYVINVEDNIHNEVWDKQYEEALPSRGFNILRSNGGFVIAGDIELASGKAANFFKINSDGEIIVGDIGNESRDGLSYGGYGQTIYSIQQVFDGNIVMVGSSGLEGHEMIYLMKVNSEGEL